MCEIVLSVGLAAWGRPARVIAIDDEVGVENCRVHVFAYFPRVRFHYFGAALGEKFCVAYSRKCISKCAPTITIIVSFSICATSVSLILLRMLTTPRPLGKHVIFKLSTFEQAHLKNYAADFILFYLFIFFLFYLSVSREIHLLKHGMLKRIQTNSS